MMLDSEKVWMDATREILRCVRGSRSQVAFSRRLGYRSNVAADWEGGHRAPTAEELLRAMKRVGIDLDAAMESFHPQSAELLPRGLHLWLAAQQGHASQADIAKRSGFSRHQVRRWLSGDARPRVPAFLRLLHALTGRAPDWVASLVPIEQVPSLHGPWQSARQASRLAYDAPWSSALLLLIHTEGYRDNPHDDWLASALGLDSAGLRDALDALLDAGLATRQGSRLVPVDAFTANASASASDRQQLKRHWAEVAASRAAAPRPGDLTSLNLISVSRTDLDAVRDLQRAYFRALRSLVAASSPEETAALVLMQVVTLDPPTS